MKVVIAEKPNLAKNIISAIGGKNFSWKDGYAENSDYIVTWTFGHLFELADMHSYLNKDSDSVRTAWSLENLPFCPKEFHYELKKDPKTKKVDPGVRKQFQTIKSLLARKDVDSIIHAGDADREGEIIIRNILRMAGNRHPVFRLWLPSQTPETIREGLRTMKNDSEYDDLAREGYARSFEDWLFGINLTQTSTLQCGSLLRVGRVITAMVKAVYDRDMEIKNFVPTPYLIVGSQEETNGEKVPLKCKKSFSVEDRAQAQALADRLNAAGAVVTDISAEEKIIHAGKLLSQTDLQALAGKKYKLSPMETLSIAQKLYDAGYATYPRTPTQYLATKEKKKTDHVIEILQSMGYHVEPKSSKKIYDDSKVESHSAITPTEKIPEKGVLSPKEQLVYDIILNRFLAVFCSIPCKVERTTITITSGDTEFHLRGDVYIQRGWMEYEDTGRSDKVLPKLSVGDNVNIFFKVSEQETKPPSHYTVESFGKFLQNPFKKKVIDANNEDVSDEEDAEQSLAQTEDEFQDDDEDYKAILSGLEIGTEATRAGIIDKAIMSEYISLKNNKYTILPGGIYYIETLWKMGITIDKYKTAELGRTLKRVYRGELSIQTCIDHCMDEVRAYFDAAVATEVERHTGPGLGSGIITTCPLCGGDVKEGKKGYYCSNYQTCSLKGLWKNACFVSITPKDVIALLKGSVISKPAKTKSGNKITKKLRYDIEDGQIVDVTFEPMTAGTAKKGEGPQTLKCPSCGSPIIERPSSFSCTNESCGFVLWKQARYFDNTLRISATKAKALLSGKHALFTLKSKTGKEYDGYLKLKVNGKYANFEADGFPDSQK